MKHSKRLSQKETVQYVLDLLLAFSLIKDEQEVANFIADLLTESEVLILAKRLRIAKLLLSGDTMDTVVSKTRAGKNTVSKISHWLEGKGLGFKKIVERLPSNSKPREIDNSYLGKLKKSYKSYFALLDSLEGATNKNTYNKHDEEKVIDIVNKLKEKRSYSKEIDKTYK